jgi:hypothetical protein
MVLTPPGAVEVLDPQEVERRRQIDVRVQARGVLVVWAYEYTWGECFFDTIAHLTKELRDVPMTTKEVRAAALDFLMQEELPRDLVDVLCHGHKGGNKAREQVVAAALQRLRTPGAEKGRKGWADLACVQAVAFALRISIVCHFGDEPLRPPQRIGGPFRAYSEGWPQYDVLYTGESEVGTGHYHPCMRLVNWKAGPFPPTKLGVASPFVISP